MLRRPTARIVLAAAAVALAAAGLSCPSFDAPRAGTTTVSSSLETHKPTLPVLLVRLARVELALDARQSVIVSALVDDAEAAARPVARARVALLETVARGVDRGHLERDADSAALADLRAAADEALPSLGTIVVELHRTLDPEQRRELTNAAERWLEGERSAWFWSREPDVRWLAAFRESVISSEALEAMQRATRADIDAWGRALERTVEDELRFRDASGRRELVHRLRTDSLPLRGAVSERP